MRAAMRGTAPMNAPGPPPTMPHRMRRFPSPALVPEIIASPGLFLDLVQTEHAAVGGMVGAGLRKIIESGTCRLDDVMGDERRALGGALLGALDAAFPFEDGPAVETVLRELGKDSGEIDLSVAG